MCSRFSGNASTRKRGYITLNLIRVPVAFLVPVLGEEFSLVLPDQICLKNTPFS